MSYVNFDEIYLICCEFSEKEESSPTSHSPIIASHDRMKGIRRKLRACKLVLGAPFEIPTNKDVVVMN